jgi:hypothetical protein
MFADAAPMVETDPDPPARLLQSCPTLGQGSFGFRGYEAAVGDHLDPAMSRRSRPTAFRQGHGDHCLFRRGKRLDDIRYRAADGHNVTRPGVFEPIIPARRL